MGKGKTTKGGVKCPRGSAKSVVDYIMDGRSNTGLPGYYAGAVERFRLLNQRKIKGRSKSMSNQSRMYKEAKPYPSWGVGCNFNCVYCKSSFQRQMKRQRCSLCRSYTPHEHPERFNNRPPKTYGDEFVFVDDFTDPHWFNDEQWDRRLAWCRKWKDRNLLIQSKAPECFRDKKFPPNVALGTTIETDLNNFNTPSSYKRYDQISSAIIPIWRAVDMEHIAHRRKVVTIEPILDFYLQDFVDIICKINPERVYIGYDSHPANKLPEPPLEKTEELIYRLEKEGIKVIRKEIRKAWWE